MPNPHSAAGRRERMPSREGRLMYADLLRVAAAVAVVVLHLSGGWMDQAGVNTLDWAVLNFYNSLTRWCVPVFVMLSGMFLLDPRKKLSLSALFRRHILPIAAALLVWACFYACLTHTIHRGPFTLSGYLEALKTVLWGKLHYHLWFLPMILGLYLITPILRAFVRGAERRDFHWFFLLTAVFALTLPAVLALRPSQTLSAWVNRLDVRLVLGYTGYYVAGYYLKTYALSPGARRAIYLAGLLGAAGTVWGTWYLSRSAGVQTLALYSYFTPNVAAMAAAVFAAFRSLPERRADAPLCRRAVRLSPLTFGIYLCHDIFISLLRTLGISTLSFSPILSVPALSALVFLCAAALAWGLSRLPVAGRCLT